MYLVDAEGRGLLPALALAPDGASSNLLPRLGLRLALGVRVDPEDPRLLPLLLDEEVIHGAGILHAVQSLHVCGVRGPRGVAVRAAARLGAPAEHVRGSVDSSLDRPSRGRRRPRGHQYPLSLRPQRRPQPGRLRPGRSELVSTAAPPPPKRSLRLLPPPPSAARRSVRCPAPPGAPPPPPLRWAFQ